MARDKITVDLLLATKQAEREIDRINRKIKKLGKAAGTSFGGPTGGGDKVRALGSGLSKATVKADEFSKSMEASNARVIAFGASAGLIMGVERALKAMVASAIKVEKAMMDVNIVMNASTQALEKFGRGMFKVAKETAQGFDTVAEAAVELARQGLGAEKTLQRTKDALILTRLTGMSAADAVKSLTAAVNSFNKEGVTSAQVINRMAKVDAKFAVSSDDLAKAISRVGASAVSAGVNMNELMAITTAVQQKTARGGAVIGNAFKTIFTRIQRSDVQKRLRDFGVATRDMQGNMLTGMKVLQNLADEFDKLTKSQQASISENVAGVFQVNILKAALSDLSQETSAYSGALRAANSATDEAYQKNEKLNQTLDSLVNRTLVNLTSAGASLGGATLVPAIENILNTVNAAIGAFAEGGVFEKFGQGMGKDLLSGIGKFISGPGLIFATAMFGKLALSLGRFVKQAAMDIMGINTATKQRAALEEAVIAHIASEPALLKKVRLGTLNVLTVEKDILRTVKLANAERARIQAYARPLAASIYGRGARTGRSGVTFGKPGGAGGFVPNFADAGSERMAAAAGGYRAGGIRTMSQPGAGTMMYNSAETVKRFPGMAQSAIMPPERSPAGAGYRGAFGAAHGFDPYAAEGFVPNFQRRAPKKKEPFVPKRPLALAARGYTTSAPNIGVALGFQGKKGSTGGIYSQRAGDITNLKGNIDPRAFGAKIKLSGVKTRAIYQPGRDETDAQGLFEGEMDRAIRGSLGIVAQSIIKAIDVDDKPIGAADIAQIKNDVKTKPLKLSPSFEGDLFEEGLRIAIQGAVPESNKAAFDFEAGAPPSKLMKRLFGSMPRNSRIDAKRQQSTADNIVNKYFSEGLVTGKRYNNIFEMLNALDTGIRDRKIIGGKGGMETFLKVAFRDRKVAKKGKAGGFVPNFSSLTDAIGREVSAGVPASAIRVGSSPSLRGAGNPGGVGVYNTLHEPSGLDQGIRRSRAQGMNPRTQGGALGWIPNFEAWNKGLDAAQQQIYSEAIADGADSKQAKKAAKARKPFKPKGGGLMSKGGFVGTAMYMGGDMVGGVIGGKGGQAVSTTMMAAGGGLMAGEMAIALLGVTGPIGLAIGAVVGLGLAAHGLYNIFKDETTPEVEKQVEAQRSLAAIAREATASFASLNRVMTDTEFLTKKRVTLEALGIKGTGADYKATESRMGGTKELEDLWAAGQQDFPAALKAYTTRLAGREAFTGVDFGKETQAALAKDPAYLAAQQAMVERRRAAETAHREYKQKVAPTLYRDYFDTTTLTTEREPYPNPRLSDPAFLSSPEGRRLKQLERELEEARLSTLGRGTGPGQPFSTLLNPRKVGGVGEFYASKFITDVSAKEPAMSPAAVAQRRAEEFVARREKEGIVDPEEIKRLSTGVHRRAAHLGGSPTRKALRQGAADAMGVDITDFEGKLQEFGRIMEAEVRAGRISARERELAMKNFSKSIIAAYTDTNLFTKSVKDLVTEDVQRKSAIQAYIDANRPLIDSIIEARRSLVQLQAGAKLSHASIMQEIQARKQVLGINQQIAKARKASTTTNREMMDVQFDQDEKKTRVNKRLAFRGAASQRRLDITTAQTATGRKAAEDLLKNAFAPGTVAGKGAEGKRDAFQKITMDRVAELMTEFATATPERAQEMLDEANKEWGRLTAQSGGMSGNLPPEQAAEYTAILAVLPKMEEALNKEHQVRQLATEKAEDEGKMSEKRRQLAIIQYNNALKLFVDQRQLDRIKEATIKKAVVLETKGRYAAGRVGYGDDLAARRAAIEAERAAGGYFVPSGRAGGDPVLVAVSAAETARKDIALTEEQIARSLDGASDNIVDATRIFTNALREAASDLVSFEEVTTAAAVREQAEKDYEKGLTTSDTLRGRRAADRLARRRTGQAKSGDVMEAFRDQFLYNDQDAMDDFEEGVVGVANTMKTSFAEAFKSIASGASSAQEAFAGMAVSILDSISDMSAQMAANMMFKQMNSWFPQNSKGGPIPRFQSGGKVVGGSGQKDDLLTMMSGGEYVIKKSSAQQIGYGTLDAINTVGRGGGSIAHYQYGGFNTTSSGAPRKGSTAGSTAGGQKGPGMGAMMAVSAGASALSGLINQANQPDPKKPWRGENYGFGRGKYGYFGGPEHDTGRASSAEGGGRSAQVSLKKGFFYYRRDPETGRLISERARPTEGKFEVSSALSLMGRLNEGDPQTSRMFGKERSLGSYRDYLRDETKRRKDVIKAHEKMKQGRRISAVVNAAMLIGGSYMMGKTGPTPPTNVPTQGGLPSHIQGVRDVRGPLMHDPEWEGAAGGRPQGSPAMLTGGEYVMSPQTVRTYGPSFMQELNRGNVPGMAGGGFVGNQGALAGMISGGEINNNVNININVDQKGNVEAKAQGQPSDNTKQENTIKETENNKELGKALQTVVLQELIRQQRPGGLLRKGPHTP